MAIEPRTLLRSYLGDPLTDTLGETIEHPFFTDDQLDDLLVQASDSVDAAAAIGWRQKMAFYASTAINVQADNSTLSREALYKHAKEQLEYYENRAGEPSDITNIRMTVEGSTVEGDEFVQFP